MRRVYLDHAATSWPKPPGVVKAMVEYQEECGAAAGRGSYRSASRANQIVLSVRRKLAELIGAGSANDIALLHNGTAALNLALAGTLQPGDHVVTTAIEHNSVLRPLAALRKRIGIEFSVVSSDASGAVDPSDVAKAISPQTKWIVVSHASNVTGCIQPIEAIAAIAKRASVRLLVDAAQTLGYLPIDVQAMGIDMLAAPGHKGACGMLGTGLLYAHPDIAETIVSPWPGGTGTESEQLEGPFAWPAGVEAGNANLPALAAWNFGLDWLMDKPISQRWSETESMLLRLRDILDGASLGTIIGHASKTSSVPVVSLAVKNMACSDLAAVLDSAFQIEVRSGMHCAALIHDFIGTKALGGTLRLSLGHTSTMADLDALEIACCELHQSGI
jgi:cysteine desulfurase / selenocysteine lyase